jgi:hypothetical protein
MTTTTPAPKNIAEALALNPMSADTITTIANAAYAETLTQVQLPELRSMDLRASTTSTALTSRTHVEYECYRSSKTIGADAIEIVFLPEINRAGVAAGSDAQWTDAISAADALRRFLNDDMSA